MVVVGYVYAHRGVEKAVVFYKHICRMTADVNATITQYGVAFHHDLKNSMVLRLVLSMKTQKNSFKITIIAIL